MPELPEVETIKLTLQRLVIGKEIKGVTIKWDNIIKFPSDLRQFEQTCIGQTIQDIERRGKFLKFMLDDYVLVSHLRMEGRYQVMKVAEPLPKHTHVIFSFTDGTELRYIDVRKFGTMHLFSKGIENETLPLSKLGVEPLSEEFTPEILRTACQKTKRTIKAVLLDQTIIAGLGNIYVDESLYRARIHPKRPAKQVTKSDIVRLHQAVIETLAEAVEKGGSTVRSYVNSQGDMGMFQFHHFVYGRQGEKCRYCETEIEKDVVAQRGTHFCPNCQV